MARFKSKSKLSRNKVKPKSTSVTKLRAAEARLKKQQSEVDKLRKAVAKPAKKIKLIKSRKAKPATKIKAPKLVKSKPAPKATTRNLTPLQRQFYQLQKLGLTKSRKKPKNLSAKDKTLINSIKKFKDVISGKAKAYKVTSEQAKSYKKAGIKIVDNIALVPKTAVKKLKNGEVRTQLLPINYKNLPAFFDALENDKNLERFRPPGSVWAFRFFGHNSHGTFRSLEGLKTILSNYKSIVAAGSRTKQRQLLDQLEIVSVRNKTEWQSKSRRKR